MQSEKELKTIRDEICKQGQEFFAAKFDALGISVNDAAQSDINDSIHDIASNISNSNLHNEAIYQSQYNQRTQDTVALQGSQL